MKKRCDPYIDFSISSGKRNRHRRQLYRLPYNRLAGFDSQTLYGMTAETGIQILVPVIHGGIRIKAILESIEKAMEGKKWVLVIAYAAGNGTISPTIREHKSSALYFVKEHITRPLPRKNIFDILISIGSAFREYFPWICFVDDESLMHPFRIDLLLPYAILHNQKAAVGDAFFCGNGGSSKEPCAGKVIRASDEKFRLENFRFGIYGMIFHQSLLYGGNGFTYTGITRMYQSVIRNQAAAQDGRIVQVFSSHAEAGGGELTESFFFSPEIKTDICPDSNTDGNIQQKLESFSIVATAKLAKELLITLKSIRQYHDQPVYLVCDSYVKDLVEKNRFGNIIIFDELNDPQLAEIRKTYFNAPYDRIWKFPPSQPNPPILIKKMDVMSYALRENRNTLMLDADLIFLNPILRPFPESVVLSPELNDYRVFLDEQGKKEYISADKDCARQQGFPAGKQINFPYQLHDVFGLFNAGFVFAGDKQFPVWWKEKFLRDSKFLEQEALNRVWTDFGFGIFSEEYNYGFWKLWRLATAQFREMIKRKTGLLRRLAFDLKCLLSGNAFLFGPYFDLLPEIFGFDEIAKAAGFSSGAGIRFNGRLLQSFHLHVFYTSEHPNLKSRWRFIRDFALYIIDSSTNELHRELMSYINFLLEKE